MGLGNLNPGCNCCAVPEPPFVLCEACQTEIQLYQFTITTSPELWDETACTFSIPPGGLYPGADGTLFTDSGKLTSVALKGGAYWELPWDEDYTCISIECDYEVVLSGGSDFGYTGLWIGDGWWLGISRQSSLQFYAARVGYDGCLDFSTDFHFALDFPDKVPKIGHLILRANKLDNGNWWVDFCIDAPDDGTYTPTAADEFLNLHIARFETSGNPFGDPIRLGVRFFSNITPDGTTKTTFYDNVSIKAH